MSAPQQPPPPEQPPPPAAQHQAAQIGLTVALSAALAELWPSLNLADLRGALPAFTAAVTLQVQRYGAVSALLAVRHYMAQRRSAGITGGFTAVPASTPPLEQVAQMVSWATQPLWTADPHTAPDGGAAPVEQARKQLEAGAQRLVTDTGRRTAVQSAARDPKATGFYRHPEPGACSFCALLATRGPVYKASSFDRSNAHFLGDERAKTHDHCHCQMEPFFGPHGSWQPTGEVAAWERQYTQATAGVHGSKAAQVAFRRAHEGRTAPAK